MWSSPTDAIRYQLDQLENQQQDRTLLRLGIALFTMTLASFGAFTMFYAKRAARETYQLAQTLAVLLFVFAVYQGLSTLITFAVEKVARRLVKVLVERGNVSERVGKAIGLVAAVAMVYATYKVLRWSVSPVIDQLPTPDEQTDIYDYVRERHGDADEAAEDELELNDD